MPVFFRVHEAGVLAYNAPGGEVYQMLDEVGIAAAYLAKIEVNDRTGTLGRSIRANRPKPEGGYRIAALVYANAKHALWVHEGTDTIFPHKGKFLTVPSHRGVQSGAMIRKEYMAAGGRASLGPGEKKPYFLAKQISGQDANPYLAEGMKQALGKDPRLGFSGNV